VSHKDGQFTLLNAIAVIGSRPKQDKSESNCSVKERSRRGHGHRPPSLFAGLLTENDATGQHCGRLPVSSSPPGYPHYRRRRVWREGLEVAIKIKGSQGNKRIMWVKVEHPFTAISSKSDVHANHNEAQNSALRRRASAYRRRQNLYAKQVAALQRVLDVQRLVHNWVRPHHGLQERTTPAMAMGYYHRPLTIHELLTLRGFDTLIP
jgi:hypothetical protein